MMKPHRIVDIADTPETPPRASSLGCIRLSGNVYQIFTNMGHLQAEDRLECIQHRFRLTRLEISPYTDLANLGVGYDNPCIGIPVYLVNRGFQALTLKTNHPLLPCKTMIHILGIDQVHGLDFEIKLD